MKKPLKIKLFLSSDLLLKFIEKIFIFFTTFIFSIWSARLIGPQNMGIYGITVAILFFFETIIYNSFTTDYFQQNDPNNTSLFSMIVYSFTFGLFIFFILNLIPIIINVDLFITNFSLYLTLISFRLLFESINSIEKVFFIKNNKIKIQLFISFFSIVTGIIIGSLLIINGNLIEGLFANLLVASFINFILSSFYIFLVARSSIIITYNSLVFNRSIKFGFVAMIESFWGLFKRVVLGIFYSPSLLAFFQKGTQFPDLVVSIVSSSFSPIYASNTSKVLNNKHDHFNLFYAFNSISSLIIYPILFILIGLGQEIILLLLGYEWLSSYTFLVIMSISLLTWPTINFTEISLKTFKSGTLYVSMSIIKRIIGFFIFVTSIYLGFEYVLYGFILYDFITLFYTLILFDRQLRFNFFIILKENLYNVVYSLPTLLISFLLSHYLNGSLINILLISFLSISLYGLISYTFRKKHILYLLLSLK